MRLTWQVLALSTVVLAACDPPGGPPVSAGLVTEADSLQCGSSAVLYVNHTANAKDLHVHASYNCIMDDSIRPPAARLYVVDAQNKVVPGQDVQIPSGTPHRGTFTVPGGGSLKLECPGISLLHAGGCQWSYSYSP